MLVISLLMGVGDGPFFLFSNAMDTYRVFTQSFATGTNATTLVQLPLAQRSQRYQKVILKTANSSLSLSSLGLTVIREANPTVNTFSCSDEKLNKIWKDGVRSIDACTVEANETAAAWQVTEEGTQIGGQHWAPCRQGTRWGDKTVQFEVRIQNGGASWGIHMVANGLIFVLDAANRSLSALEGLSDTGGVFGPSTPRGSWALPSDVDLNSWIAVEMVADGASVSAKINNANVASVTALAISPLLGGSDTNTGSVTFGGPNGYISVYRNLLVQDLNGSTLYDNAFQLADEARTLADFAVGTNSVACTIDGAKRDRATFGGDLFIAGRSNYYSTANFEAVLGSIKLLTSHQTSDGYLGNLAPIQAPLDEGTAEPPTYAFYSLSYALMLIVAIKDYWLFSGDEEIIPSVWTKLERLLAFTESYVDSRGLVVAPIPLSCKFIIPKLFASLMFIVDFLPLGGPIIGASGKINIAYYDALNSMSQMSSSVNANDTFSAKASTLKENIRATLYSNKTGIMKMSDLMNSTGLCQDINAWAVTTGLTPQNEYSQSLLSAPLGTTLPLAFQNLVGWDSNLVVSPYTSGFAVEALFSLNNGTAALTLLERVWGPMADETGPNYSEGHWESMKSDGTPYAADTSLQHGWSTWPVFLLPKYLSGLSPLESGWKRFQVKPVLAGINNVDVGFETKFGRISVSLKIHEAAGNGTYELGIPSGTVAEVSAPEGWVIEGGGSGNGTTSASSRVIEGQTEVVNIFISKI